MKTAQGIIRWIRRQVKLADKKGVVVGLSGGLDSALTAVLCRKALGGRRVIGLMLSCDSLPGEERDARQVARKFKIPYKEINIKLAYAMLCRVLPVADKKILGNLKARLRMAVIYYFANRLDYLVAGTSNKSEVLAGYFTKFGDGASDILPLGGLFKTEVVKLAGRLGLPREIIAKPPTAGLWPGQTDEKEMGISYAELDAILSRLISGGKAQGSSMRIKKVKRMMRSSAHKRQPAPVFNP